MDLDDTTTWPTRLRDEMLPYAAFYGIGLIWLSAVGTMSAWSPGLGFFVTAATVAVGAPTAFLVSLMMVWRMTMFGIDSGRVTTMVASIGSSLVLGIVALSVTFPALALGWRLGEAQLAILGGF